MRALGAAVARLAVRGYSAVVESVVGGWLLRLVTDADIRMPVGRVAHRTVVCGSTAVEAVAIQCATLKRYLWRCCVRVCVTYGPGGQGTSDAVGMVSGGHASAADTRPRYSSLPQLGKRAEAMRVSQATYYMAILAQPIEWLWDRGRGFVVEDSGT